MCALEWRIDMTALLTNIDSVRAEIMQLEDAEVFDQRAWAKVLIALTDRPCARADAARRMETAKGNAKYFIGVDMARGEDRTVVSVETNYNADGSLKAYWVELKDDDWGRFIHAESAGKAKMIYFRSYPFLGYPEYVDIRATRAKGSELLDITPFTDATLRLAGYQVYQEGDIPNGHLDDCPCSMCGFERAKPAYQFVHVVNETEVWQ
jgi:hypothetical protein